MRFNELNINEAPFDTFQQRSSGGGSIAHGKDVAKGGGSTWRDASLGRLPDQQELLRQKQLDRQRGNTPGTDTTGTGSDVTTDPGAPNNPGSAGDLRFSSAALTTLNGAQSDMTNASAGDNMQQTIRRAQEMARIFGSTITVNDAIAKQGTSRERETQGSQHFQGTALDLSTAGMDNATKLRLYNAAIAAGFKGFGFGEGILHVDTGNRRHWAYGNSTYGGVRVRDLGQLVATNQQIRIPRTTATA
jgi:hypothetical protein